MNTLGKTDAITETAEKITIYVTYTDSDFGYVPIAVCTHEITAKRHLVSNYTGDVVKKLEMVKIDGKWYVPREAVNILEPSHDDIIEQERLDKKNAIVEKIKAAGLTDNDINELVSFFAIKIINSPSPGTKR